MSVIKLEPGTPVIATIHSVEDTEGKFGPQVKFTTDLGDIYLSENAAHQQLKRMNENYESVVGKAIKFERVKKDGKTYTNMNAEGKGNGTKPTPRPQPTAQRPASRPLGPLYNECMAAARQAFGNAGVQNPDHAALASATATLFIRASQSGDVVEPAFPAALRDDPDNLPFD